MKSHRTMATGVDATVKHSDLGLPDETAAVCWRENKAPKSLNTMTNETPETLKQLRQILAKQGTANDDITHNSRNHWRKIAAKGFTRGRLKSEPCVICGGIAEMHHTNYRKPYEVTWLCQLHHRQLHALEHKLKRDKQWPVQSQDASNDV